MDIIEALEEIRDNENLDIDSRLTIQSAIEKLMLLLTAKNDYDELDKWLSEFEELYPQTNNEYDKGFDSAIKAVRKRLGVVPLSEIKARDLYHSVSDTFEDIIEWKLVKPKCSIGDKIYKVLMLFGMIVEWEIIHIISKENGFSYIIKMTAGGTKSVEWLDECEIDKKEYYSTKEKAEEQLKN